MKFSKTIIPATTVISLTWCGDALIDWVRGGTVFHLDGKCTESRRSWAFPFDAACATRDGRFAIIYQRLGTKALLLREGKLLRELNRSFYHAHVYEYPICLWQAAERTFIAHCPDDYCRIDIEDAETGERLTNAPRKPQDMFHSRLAVNGTATCLLSAGWLWHPLDVIETFDLEEAFRNPAHLDEIHLWPTVLKNAEIEEQHTACWQTSDRLLVNLSVDEFVSPEASEQPAHAIAVFDVTTRTCVQSVPLEHSLGTIMPIGTTHVVSFSEHPKLISLESGKIEMEWEELSTGKQHSSILWGTEKLPPLAMDVEHQRFAFFGLEGITVIQIDAGTQ
jgi:hypothetical protein